MVFEICAESYEAVELARKYKVKRVELCSALSLGGLTPSHGLVAKCASIKEVEVHVMIRHKQGDFMYNFQDLDIMQRDIVAAAKLGAKGVVFGCLSQDNHINLKQSALLLETAKEHGLEVTFHRAFDFCSNIEKSLQELISMGFDRVLTSGKANVAENGIEVITQMVRQAKGEIQIMAGSGVNENNVLKLVDTGVDALHFSVHTSSDEPVSLGMGANTILNERKVKSIINQF